MKRALLLAFVALASLVAWAQTKPPVDRLAGVKTKAEIDQVVAKIKSGTAQPGPDMDLFRRDVGATYRIFMNRVPASTEPAGGTHANRDEIFVVYTGGGQMTIGGELTDKKTIAGGKTQHVGPGDVISVPRGTPHEIHADPGTEIWYLVIHVTGEAPKAKP